MNNVNDSSSLDKCLQDATLSVRHFIRLVNSQLDDWKLLSSKEGTPRNTATKELGEILSFGENLLYAASRGDYSVISCLMRPVYDLYFNSLFITLPPSSRQYAHHTIFKIHGCLEANSVVKRFREESGNTLEWIEERRIRGEATRLASSLIERETIFLASIGLSTLDSTKLVAKLHDDYETIRYTYLTEGQAEADANRISNKRQGLVKAGNITSIIADIIPSPRRSIKSGKLSKYSSYYLHPNYGSIMMRMPQMPKVIASCLAHYVLILYHVMIFCRARYFNSITPVSEEIEKAYRDCRQTLEFAREP